MLNIFFVTFGMPVKNLAASNTYIGFYFTLL